MTSSPVCARAILTIGNSFSWSLTKFFPQVVESAGCYLFIDYAMIGGCELYRHWSYIEAEEKDPDCKTYAGKTKSMKDLLLERKWDIVTIQQASHQSWIPDNYEPYATNIIDYVHKYAPTAEICIQQTWAYRKDDPRIMPGGAWNIDQDEMYRRLTQNYIQLSKNHGGLRIIPTGQAVQMARKHQPHAFVNYDPKLLNTLQWPDLPSQAWALVGTMNWKKDAASGNMVISRDTIHLNARGEYLQACVWFAKLYGRPTSDITFVPESIGDEDAAFLREMAQMSVDTPLD